MDGYAADFERFRQAGRIGASIAQLTLRLDQTKVIPGQSITGTCAVQGGRLESLAWRMRGHGDWRHLQPQGAQFSLHNTQNVGTVEFRAVARGAGGGEVSETLATVDVAWPCAAVAAEFSGTKVLRYDGLDLRVHARWVRELCVILPDGTQKRFAPETGSELVESIHFPCETMGEQSVVVQWMDMDERIRNEILNFEVLPRPMVLKTHYLESGGILFRSENATDLELRIPTRGLKLRLPTSGVIEGTFLSPVSGFVAYRDESGARRQQRISMDFAPQSWSPLQGFSSQ